MNISDLIRRIDNLIRLGTIAAVDHQAARCTVSSGGLTVPNLPWLALRAGSSLDWDPPTVGEQCILFSPSGEPAQGVALVGLYSQQRPAPANSANVRRRTYPDGAVIDYDHDSHTLTATLPDGGKAQITATGGVTILGDVTITGLVTVSDDVVAAGISLVSHVHSGVQSGPSSTGKPQ
ncbi:phage baseplate assembly protein V [Stutzerimonas zhaodongensis]|uniref:Phage baseplate assembly protein V n=1 Tax=Stutzerimonas zhaodongensis TaxID=1176257 RepID=A0A3M2HSI9_9GAMM|nr:phage baseplate assembly protein V [Stutzerimonas zhaodongensis]MCQ4314480.1 phage baseplate assembly protein V [Stutzerimonas zhaodongensis]RMH91998.1 phage baseplate assembly protein V [Stutzerimonas zhaodongensis]